jgi:MFS family permease
MPSIPQISSDLSTTPEMVGYTVAIFIFTIGAAPLVWSTLSRFYGRRMIYLWSLPIYVAACIGVARCQNVGALIGTRILQAIGQSNSRTGSSKAVKLI